MTTPIHLAASTCRVLEGVQIFYPGNTPIFSITVEGVTSISATGLAMYAYKQSTDKSSTYLTGSMSVNGNVITTKQFTGLVGGDELFVTVDGNPDGAGVLTLAEFILRVRKRSGK